MFLSVFLVGERLAHESRRLDEMLAAPPSRKKVAREESAELCPVPDCGNDWGRTVEIVEGINEQERHLRGGFGLTDYPAGAGPCEHRQEPSPGRQLPPGLKARIAEALRKSQERRKHDTD